MKKTYITPEALSISLDPKMPLLLGYSRSTADEGQFTKGYVSGGSDEGNTSTTGSSKNIWSEEW